MSTEAATRLEELAERYELPIGATRRLRTLLDLVAGEPSAITTVRDPSEAVDLHVADSLVALELDVVRGARRIADLGSGVGFPGLALAIALPAALIALVESTGRKCAFLSRAVVALGLTNVEVFHARVEAWPGGLDAHDVVTTRALAPLPVLVEYAAPLLTVGGTLVAWKGRREPIEEADGYAAAALLGMTAPIARRVSPFPSARQRHLYLSSKVTATPAKYPRRPGIARKRPIRAST